MVALGGQIQDLREKFGFKSEISSYHNFIKMHGDVSSEVYSHDPLPLLTHQLAATYQPTIIISYL
jgi:hypothetical protein